jgi:TIR domain/Pentapeptide repeats (8 copies)
MADPEHVELVKRGPGELSAWASEHPDIRMDLSFASLQSVSLRLAFLRGANLAGAVLGSSDLRGADLRGADLRGASLHRADLESADLIGAQFGSVAWATGFQEAAVRCAREFRGESNCPTDAGFDFSHAYGESSLGEANLSHVFLERTLFCELDLSRVKGLETAVHLGPSFLTAGTLQASRGRLHERFLRGCGLAEWEIEHARLYDPALPEGAFAEIQNRASLLRFEQGLQFTNLFLSYSHADSEFLDALKPRLRARGINFWWDVHDAPAGPLDKIVPRAMRLNPTVLLVLSEQSVESDWVEHEAELARELEKKLRRHVICPVALDDAWKTCAWSGPLRTQIKKYNVLDFSEWRESGLLDRQFGRLVEGLGLFYRPGRAAEETAGA